MTEFHIIKTIFQNVTPPITSGDQPNRQMKNLMDDLWKTADIDLLMTM